MTQWQDAFKTGYPEIDHQHQELFLLVSALDQAIQGHNQSELNDIIIFLERYAESHFKEEESLMKSADYKGYSHHKNEHEKFTRWIHQIRQDYDQNHPPTHIIFSIRQLIDTLVNHVLTIDIGISDIGKHE